MVKVYYSIVRCGDVFHTQLVTETSVPILEMLWESVKEICVETYISANEPLWTSITQDDVWPSIGFILRMPSKEDITADHTSSVGQLTIWNKVADRNVTNNDNDTGSTVTRFGNGKVRVGCRKAIIPCSLLTCLGQRIRTRAVNTALVWHWNSKSRQRGMYFS